MFEIHEQGPGVPAGSSSKFSLQKTASHGVAVGVGLGEGVGVGLGVSVGVGLGGGVAHSVDGPWIATVMGVPVLKKPSVAFVAVGGVPVSNRKLYKVPQRNAFAFGFWAKVSVNQLAAEELPLAVQGVLLYPASPTVPSLAIPG